MKLAAFVMFRKGIEGRAGRLRQGSATSAAKDPRRPATHVWPDRGIPVNLLGKSCPSTERSRNARMSSRETC
jgi:hypothetical protein